MFTQSLIIEFRNNVRMLLIKRSSFKSSIWITNIRHFDQMRGTYLTTPSYLVVQVNDSEISNPSTDKIIFMGLNHKKDNEANEREKDKYEIISSFTVTSTSFQADCEINIVKVKNVEISNSNFNRTRLNMNIHQSKMGDISFVPDKDGGQMAISDLITENNMLEEFNVHVGIIEKMNIQNCNLSSGSLEINEVNSVEIHSSQLDKHSFKTNVVRYLNINSCEFEDVEFNVNDGEKKANSGKSTHVLLVETIFKGFTVKIRKLEGIKILNCTFENNNGKIILVGALTNKNCSAKRPSDFVILENNKITSTSLKIHNFMKLNLVDSDFNMSIVSLKNISPPKVCSIQNKISENNFLDTHISISKVRKLSIIQCIFTDAYLTLGHIGKTQADHTDRKTLPLNTELEKGQYLS